MNTSNESPDISVITPSYNGLPFLKLCCASVADQQGVRVEHIVVDGGSSDGTVEWLKTQSSLSWVSEPDHGMYDAINKGLRRAGGRYLAYLNCDEQYLPSALSRVRAYLDDAPLVDLVFGHTLLVRPDGSLLAYRKSYPLRWAYVLASHLYASSCTTFFRRRIVDEGVLYDHRWKTVGDADFVVRLLRHGYQARNLPEYLAAFTITGSNSSASSRAEEECRQMLAEAPAWVRWLRAPLNIARLLEKFGHGAYSQKWPLQYSIYAPDDVTQRKSFTAEGASFRWATRP